MSEKQIWDRQEGETDSSWSAFCAYRDDLSGRTLLKAYQQHKDNLDAVNVPGWFAAWSVSHNWVERVRAYDAALEQQAREEREAVWLERQRQLLEDEWQASRTLLAKANAMMNEPILGLKWTADTPVRYFQLAAALGRQATGLDVVKHEHTGVTADPSNT